MWTTLLRRVLLIMQGSSCHLPFCAIKHLVEKSVKACAQKYLTDDVSHKPRGLVCSRTFNTREEGNFELGKGEKQLRVS
ncbi:hypothetical protein CEXT_597341 [Caerostris extrusa]|uniref:Secreted protein n=1 Tax=Caerostris extrusa TaxID=172846 RepID=A0AAV4Q2T8_CAEEX|nr:hypothetical protein CEXT_597341 [Caerostris extrusa]